MATRSDRVRVWAVPSALALSTALGLCSALLGDGAWDALSWTALGVPLAVCLWFGAIRRTPPR